MAFRHLATFVIGFAIGFVLTAGTLVVKVARQPIIQTIPPLYHLHTVPA